ncbi:MAG: spore cortex biosynthesis protein YabQ [Lachnospiraceae bacterium]|nr:spore cortex biosynthesis protein YabQ [Lachnospiraceae bacterium]
MSGVIRREAAIFLISVLHGAALTLLYDFLRALRRSFRHSLPVLSIEDFLFWLFAGFLTFYLTFRETGGVIRGYVAAGMGIGILLYHFSVSPKVVQLLSSLFSLLYQAVTYPLRVLLTVARKIAGFFCKINKKRIEFTRKRVYNRRTDLKGRIQRGRSKEGTNVWRDRKKDRSSCIENWKKG